MWSWLRHILCLVFVAGVINANVPFHDLVHEHTFVEVDHCGHSCKRHLKEYVKPCCKMTDAVRQVSLLPPQQYFNFPEQVFLPVNTPYFVGNSFKLHFFSNNKAPPLS